MKLKDFVNQKTNKRNHQISFDVKKRKLNEFDVDIEDLMEMDVPKMKVKKLREVDF